MSYMPCGNGFHPCIIEQVGSVRCSGLQGKASPVMHTSAEMHTTVIVLACVKLLHVLGKVPAPGKLVKLMEQLDVCQLVHCCCVYLQFCASGQIPVLYRNMGLFQMMHSRHSAVRPQRSSVCPLQMHSIAAPCSCCKAAVCSVRLYPLGLLSRLCTDC